MTETAARPTQAVLGARYWKLWTSSVISNLGDGVSQIAYPWLASAVTRDPVLIAIIAVAQRLPWLVFTLPAGVITDRLDRRKIMVAMQGFRMAVTIAVAIAVFAYRDTLPTPDEIAGGIELSTNVVLYVVLVITALLFGLAEVLYDNSAQTILPALVVPESLEKANGNLWGAEMVANSFVGPPLGSLLIAIGFAVPFLVDAGSFAVSAALLFLITGVFTAARPDGEPKKVRWWAEIKEGFGWLWRHPLLRPMAIILGLLNMLGMVGWATFVLFAQEVLDVSPFVFAVLLAAGAIGGTIGSFLAPRISKALGSGPSLYLTIIVGGVTALGIAVTSQWPVVWLMTAIGTFTAILWNVITVSLRQTIIPDRLLGRVNSVYRFFGWGMMPIGLLVGGLLVSLTETAGGSRELGLRVPWLFVAGAHLLLFLYAAPKLTTAKIETAREEGVAAKAAESALLAPPEDDDRRGQDGQGGGDGDPGDG